MHTDQHADTLSIFVYESVFVSEQTAVEIIIITIFSCGSLSFTAKELAKLREVLRVSIGSHTDALTREDLIEFGTSMLYTTAVILKAKHSQSKSQLNKE